MLVLNQRLPGSSPHRSRVMVRVAMTPKSIARLCFYAIPTICWCWYELSHTSVGRGCHFDDPPHAAWLIKAHGKGVFGHLQLFSDAKVAQCPSPPQKVVSENAATSQARARARVCVCVQASG
jgi:hypothetical protein